MDILGVTDKNFDYTYDESEGTHEWGYWDMQIQKILKWLPIKIEKDVL